MKWNKEYLKRVFIFFYFLDVWKMLKDKKFDDVSIIIKEQPNLINSMRGDWGNTFLMKAAYYEHKDIVGYLLNQQQDLSIINVGENVLHFIVEWNDDDVAFEMLKSLDFSQLNDDVIDKQTNGFKQTPLHLAARKNNHKSIVCLMDRWSRALILRWKMIGVSVLVNIVVVLMKQKTSFKASKNGHKYFFDEDFLNFFNIFPIKYF